MMNILKKINSFITRYRRNADILETLYKRTAYLSHENGKIKFQQKSGYERHTEYKKKLSYHHFKKYFDGAVFFDNTNLQRQFSINKSKSFKIEKAPPFFLEFGVFNGESINFFSNFVKKIYGFDSFLGLNEDWKSGYLNHVEGIYGTDSNLPKVKNNVFLIQGKAQDTLDEFLKNNKPNIVFIHFDVDTYETTKFILQRVKPYLSQETIFLFDEFYDFSGWDVGEYKAFKEEIEMDSNFNFEYLGFHTFDNIVTVKVIKKN